MFCLAYAELLRQLGYDASVRITMRINNETKYVLKQAKVEVPEELPDASGLNIVLEDHSEYLQAAEGMKDAHIVGVIDHHGVGSITTGYQFGIGCVNAKDEDKAMDLAKRVHAVLPRAIKVRSINYMYAAVRVEGDGKKIDFYRPGG
ncbi:MAG: hypothetical protein J6E46_07080 [Faecalicoccus sp.]|nr:hypothetical protein [Faecalicoccus sp.]